MAPTTQERREVPEPRAFGEPRPGQVEEVTGFVESLKDAWSRQDANGLVALHAEDVEWINAYARMFQGAEPLAALLRRTHIHLVFADESDGWKVVHSVIMDAR